MSNKYIKIPYKHILPTILEVDEDILELDSYDIRRPTFRRQKHHGGQLPPKTAEEIQMFIEAIQMLSDLDLGKAEVIEEEKVKQRPIPMEIEEW